jgi:hypothetical protein
MTAATDKRADRFPVPLKVYYSYERVEGAASLTNISYTGALLENTPMRPEIGTCVQLYVHLKPPCTIEPVAPSKLIGVVVRHSSNGFAVKFENSHDPDLRRMVDDAAAILTAER